MYILFPYYICIISTHILYSITTPVDEEGNTNTTNAKFDENGKLQIAQSDQITKITYIFCRIYTMKHYVLVLYRLFNLIIYISNMSTLL